MCVDLDGTLTPTDLGYESLLSALACAPWQTLCAVLKAPRGRQQIKQRLQALANVDTQKIPLNEVLLQRLDEIGSERQLVLVTGSTQAFADAILQRLPQFEQAMGSTDALNCVGADKARVLQEAFGETGFDYIGNSRTDLPVWAAAEKAWVVSGSTALVQAARRVAEVEVVLKPEQSVGALLRLLRPHQWLKNLLLLLPLLAGHISTLSPWLSALLGIFSFSALASAGYIINDALDIQADRQHPRKCRRPLAAGAVPLSHAAVLTATLLLLGGAAALALGPVFFLIAATYLTGTLSYSFVLKRMAPLDVFALASLYSIRVYAGGVAAAVPVSAWLLTFSVFVFLSLALVKRYAELAATSAVQGKALPGRGWQSGDLQFIGGLGLAAAVASGVILAIYLQSTASAALYSHPDLLVLTIMTTTLWLTHLWLRAVRGQMHDDPVIFALRDPGSLFWLGLTLLIAIIAA